MFKKIAKWFGSRLWDLTTNNVGLVVTWIAGGGLVFYVGSLTEWARWLGPLGWALIAVGTMFVVSLGYAAWAFASTRMTSKSLADAKARSGVANVLAPTHTHERINLSDFYSPFFFQTRNVVFTDCELYGPANVAASGCTFNKCGFVDCEIIIVRDDRPVKGATAFEHCTFLRGRLVRLTLLMNFASYQALPQAMRQKIPVISDGRIGDV